MPRLRASSKVTVSPWAPNHGRLMPLPASALATVEDTRLAGMAKPMPIEPPDLVKIAELKREGKLDRETAHRQVKYLNNVIEADHGKLKILIKPVRGFKSIPTASATLKGFEVTIGR